MATSVTIVRSNEDERDVAQGDQYVLQQEILKLAREGAKIRIRQIRAEIEHLEAILSQLAGSRRVVGTEARVKRAVAQRPREARREAKAAPTTPPISAVTTERGGRSPEVLARIAEAQRARHARLRQERESAAERKTTRLAEAAAEAARRRMLPRHVPRAQRLQVSALSTPAEHPTGRREDEPQVVADAAGGDWSRGQGSMVTRWQRVPVDTNGGRDVEPDDVTRLLETFRSM